MKPVGLFVGSDLHAGSEGFMSEAFVEHARAAHAAGIRHGALVGDLLDGDYDAHGRYEQTEVGYARQSKRLLRAMRSLRSLGWTWWVITGNHDHTYLNRAGLEVGPELEKSARELGLDVRYLGDRAGRFELGGAVVELWHPGGGGNGLSALERRAAGYQRGTEPDLLLVGHHHQYAHVEHRGVHTVLCPTLQHGCSSFGRSMAKPQSEGTLQVWFQAGERGRGLRRCVVSKTTAFPVASSVPRHLTRKRGGFSGPAGAAAPGPFCVLGHLASRGGRAHAGDGRHQ